MCNKSKKKSKRGCEFLVNFRVPQKTLNSSNYYNMMSVSIHAVIQENTASVFVGSEKESCAQDTWDACPRLLRRGQHSRVTVLWQQPLLWAGLQERWALTHGWCLHVLGNSWQVCLQMAKLSNSCQALVYIGQVCCGKCGAKLPLSSAWLWDMQREWLIWSR